MQGFCFSSPDVFNYFVGFQLEISHFQTTLQEYHYWNEIWDVFNASFTTTLWAIILFVSLEYLQAWELETCKYDNSKKSLD